jgi:hypothetical protein
MAILAIDPGTNKSGWCLLMPDGKVLAFGWSDNHALAKMIYEEHTAGTINSDTHVLIEDISNYGMPVGRDTFETVKWMGRFDTIVGSRHQYITRPTIKAALCNDVKAKDANVRQAVIDWYGGEALAIGGKKCLNCKGKGWTGRDHDACEFCHCAGCGMETHKGQLYGVSSHVWSALALGITYIEQKKQQI